MLSAVGQFCGGGGGGGGCCPLSADSAGGGGGAGAVRCRPILRGGGGGCCPLSADSTSGGGGGCCPLSADSTSGGGGGAVRCRPIQLVCAVRFNKWEVRMKARVYKLKSQGGPTADFTVQT